MQVISNFFGFVTLTATYNGDLTFSPSGMCASLDVIGDHLVFNPAPPADVPQGNRFAGIIEVHNGAEAIISSYDGFPVTLTITDTCGNTDTIGPVNVA